MSENEGSFSAEERAAMKQRAEELRSLKGVKGSAKKAREYEACIEAIDSLTGSDRVIAQALHRIVSTVAPELDPKTWYGFPTYAKDGKNIVFYQPASKFKTRYGTVGFEQAAALDDGEMWAVAYAVIAINSQVEEELADLVRRAVRVI